MKLLLAIVTFALGLALPQLRAGEAPPKPGPEHQKLAMFAGKWKGEMSNFETPFGPAGKATGAYEGRLVHGGFHVEIRGKGRSPIGGLSWTEIYYFDPIKNSYGNFYFDSIGGVGVAEGTNDGNTWTFTWDQRAKDKIYKGKNVITFAADGKSSSHELTYSEDGTSWKPGASGKAKRVGKAK